MITVEQMMSAHKSNVETMFGLSGLAFDGVEKLIELNVQATRAAMAGMAESTQALMSAKDPQELVALQAGWMQPRHGKGSRLRPQRLRDHLDDRRRDRPRHRSDRRRRAGEVPRRRRHRGEERTGRHRERRRAGQVGRRRREQRVRERPEGRQAGRRSRRCQRAGNVLDRGPRDPGRGREGQARRLIDRRRPAPTTAKEPGSRRAFFMRRRRRGKAMAQRWLLATSFSRSSPSLSSIASRPARITSLRDEKSVPDMPGSFGATTTSASRSS